MYGDSNPKNVLGIIDNKSEFLSSLLNKTFPVLDKNVYSILKFNFDYKLTTFIVNKGN